MGEWYPGLVSRHNLVSPLLTFLVPVPVRDIGHDGGRCVFGRHGATHDLAQRGVSRSGRESFMAVDRFCRNVVGPPEWECEAMGSVVWVQCATSAECMFNLSIAASSVMGMGSY